jgi:Trypsin
LIAPDIILTAGHCAGRFNQIQLGRHNIFDFNSTFESYVIQDSVLHPRARGDKQTPEYDFFLIKLYGRSELQPIMLNTDPNMPGATGEDLLVTGWGTLQAYSKILSPSLQRVVLDYVTNEDCLKIEGTTTTGNNTIDFETRIIPVTMCAIDLVGDGDSCQGDSGGPLMVNPTSDDASNDVQVGVVSFGFNGCGSPIFPGIYARVSYVAPWIQEMVCKMSNDPPARFGCPFKPNQPDLSGELVTINIQIELDDKPAQNGWIIQSENEAGIMVTYQSRPIFFFADQEPRGIVLEYVKLPNNRQYTITMLDSYGNGMCCGGNSAHWPDGGDGSLWIYEGSANASSNDLVPKTLLLFESFDSFTFTVGVLPTSSPTVTPAPSITIMPSTSPTMSRPYVSIEIKLDLHPEETGWELEALVPNDAPILVAAQYPGAYANETGRIIEHVNLFLAGDDPITYRFRAADTSNDGICCSSGFGFYRVWFGEPETGAKVVEIDRFYVEKYFDFIVEDFGSSPTSAPPSSPTSAASFLGSLSSFSMAFLSTSLLFIGLGRSNHGQVGGANGV